MKAVFFERHGGPEVVRFGERPTPRPAPDQVLIEVHAAGVNPRDWMLYEGTYIAEPLSGRRPIVLGSDVSGVVVSVGSRVRRFSVGDEVFAMQSHLGKMGGFAEYAAVKAACVARKPDGVSHIEAAAAPVAALTAWQALFDYGRIGPGSRVAVIGAAGGVGHYAVQFARGAGAEVTAVCGPANVDFARELGAERVVDYTREPWPRAISGQDLVFDTIGRERVAAGSACAHDAGRYVTTLPTVALFAATACNQVARLVRPGRRTSVVRVQPRGHDLAAIGRLLAGGQARSVVDAVYPLADAAEALRRSKGRHVRGKLVLEVALS